MRYYTSLILSATTYIFETRYFSTHTELIKYCTLIHRIPNPYKKTVKMPMYFDVSHGKRETVDEAMATALTAPLVESAEPVEGFCLSNKSYTRAGAEAVAKA